jgi:hypothetical protein
LIFGVKLLNDTRRGRYDADFAEARAGRPIASIRRDIGNGRELPDIGALAAVHLKYACWRPELKDERIHVLTDVLVTKSGDNFLLRRSAAAKRRTKRNNPQNSH